MNANKNKIVVALLLLTVFVSCKKDDIPPIPELTPVGSFSMEYDDFNNAKSANLLKLNWIYSATNVSIFSIMASASMAIPTIAFSESFNHTPTYSGDQIWQWSYNIPVLGATYTAKLNGITEKKNKVKWEMYVDKTGTGGFTNFLWFEGTTTDSTAANWIVYNNLGLPAPVLNIEWESNSDHSESTLKYTNVNTTSENLNSYIEFGKSPAASFDRFYNIYLKNENATININWNSDTKDGRVKSPSFFKDQNWRCWNEQLQDAWCD